MLQMTREEMGVAPCGCGRRANYLAQTNHKVAISRAWICSQCWREVVTDDERKSMKIILEFGEKDFPD